MGKGVYNFQKPPHVIYAWPFIQLLTQIESRNEGLQSI